MKFLFVSRKKYNILKENYKKSVEHRQDLEKRNIEMQKELVKSKNEIIEVKRLLKDNKREPQILKRCIKCNKYFTTPEKSRRKICTSCKAKRKGGN